MSKLSFRARALDPAKPMPIFLAEELPDLPEYSAINRAVPQMPSGMEKEEESEHHLQRAICTGLIIPTPEVFDIESKFYDRLYPADYKMPKQYIHMQPLAMEQDIPDYDMDSADEGWVNSQSRRLDITAFKFEQMMDRLEKSSGQTVVTLNEAKALLKQDDEVSIAIYDYWLNKRLKMQHPLILSVKTENRPGAAQNNPYLAFRRRTEKMQTRKNRKNDEVSYEKMLKLRRDLSRAITLLEMVKRREKSKREILHLGIEVFEKRYQNRDFNGHLLAEFSSNVAKQSRPAFAPIYCNQFSHSTLSSTTSTSTQWINSSMHHFPTSQYNLSTGQTTKRDIDNIHSSNAATRKEKRQYKKRKHKNPREKVEQHPNPVTLAIDPVSSEDDDVTSSLPLHENEDNLYSFKRNKYCQYHKPLAQFGNWPWTSKEENGLAEKNYRFSLTSIRNPKPRCIGFTRRRIGRGGRVILDRVSTDVDNYWSSLDYTIFDTVKSTSIPENSELTNSVVVALKSDKDDNHNRSNNHLSVVEKLKINNNTRTNNNYCNNVINNDKIENDDKNSVRYSLQQDTVDIGIKQEKIDNEYDKVLENYDSVNIISNLTNFSTLMSTPFSHNNVIKTENVSQNSSSGVSSMLSTASISSLSASGNATLQGSKLNSQIPSSLNSENPTSDNLTNIINTIPSQLPKLNEKCNQLNSESSFNNVLMDIKTWPHFCPKSPEEVCRSPLFEDIPQYSDTTPLCVEVQTLTDTQTSSIYFENMDNLFSTSAFSLTDVLDDNYRGVMGSNSLDASSSSSSELNSNADSLNELNLSLGESLEDNEKVLDTILQDCQIEDLKSFHTTSNFWNGILEDTGFLNSLDIAEDKKFDKSGYDSEFLNELREPRSGLNKRKCTSRIGHSAFSVSNCISDNFFKKESPKKIFDDNSNPTSEIHTKSADLLNNTECFDDTKIKLEPMETMIPTTSQLAASNSIYYQNPVAQNLPIMKPVVSQAESMIVLSSSSLRKHMNGPSNEKTGLQNMLKPNTNVRKITTHTKSDGDGVENRHKKDLGFSEQYIKVSLPADFNNVSNNLNLVTASATTSNSNHSYSLHPNTALQQSLIVAGQSNLQNKIILNSGGQSTSSVGTSNITIPNPIQELLVTGGQNKLMQTQNIKVNLIPTSNNQQDIKNFIASPLHPGLLVENKGNVASTAHQQNRIKVEKMLYETGSNDANRGRILYTTNFKNNRGQILAHINPKVVNILPIQHNKNNSPNIHTVVAASSASTTNYVNKATTQTLQRFSSSSLPNTSNIRSQQATNAIGTVDNNINKIITSNDNNTATTVSGININTGNR